VLGSLVLEPFDRLRQDLNLSPVKHFVIHHAEQQLLYGAVAKPINDAFDGRCGNLVRGSAAR
jgi:hypothetical protein